MRPPARPWRACRWATAPSPSTALPGDDSRALWGHTYERARTHLLALRVEDLGAATDALHRAGITIVRWGGDLVVLDPAATGGVQIALTDALLPGDPRL